jgi:hypothetical protein
MVLTEQLVHKVLKEIKVPWVPLERQVLPVLRALKEIPDQDGH